MRLTRLICRQVCASCTFAHLLHGLREQTLRAMSLRAVQ